MTKDVRQYWVEWKDENGGTQCNCVNAKDHQEVISWITDNLDIAKIGIENVEIKMMAPIQHQRIAVA